MLVIKLLTVAINFQSKKNKKYYGVPSTLWLLKLFKVSFVFNRRKKLVQVWNNMSVSNVELSFLKILE